MTKDIYHIDRIAKVAVRHAAHKLERKGSKGESLRLRCALGDLYFRIARDMLDKNWDKVRSVPLREVVSQLSGYLRFLHLSAEYKNLTGEDYSRCEEE